MASASSSCTSTESLDVPLHIQAKRYTVHTLQQCFDYAHGQRVNVKYYGKNEEARAHDKEMERLGKLVAAGELSESCLHAKPRPRPPRPLLHELTMEDKQKIALNLMDAKALRKYESLQRKKQKAEQKMMKAKAKIQHVQQGAEGPTSDRQLKKEAKKKRYFDIKILRKSQKNSKRCNNSDEKSNDNVEKKADVSHPGCSSVQPENCMDKERRRQEAIAKERVQQVQEAERKRHPKQKSFLDSPSSTTTGSFNNKKKYDWQDNIKNIETFIEVFDAEGNLISVNGTAIDWLGHPIYSDKTDLKGKLLSINSVVVKDIPDFDGEVIRDNTGNIISMFGAPAREEIRDGNGALLYLNGIAVGPDFEKIHTATQMIEELAQKTGGTRQSLASKIATTLGAKQKVSCFKEVLIQQVEDCVVEMEKKMIEEANRATKIEKHLKDQENSDLKAEQEQTKQRAKILNKKLVSVEKEKEREHKEREKQLEQQQKEKEKELEKELKEREKQHKVIEKQQKEEEKQLEKELKEKKNQEEQERKEKERQEKIKEEVNRISKQVGIATERTQEAKNAENWVYQTYINRCNPVMRRHKKKDSSDAQGDSSVVQGSSTNQTNNVGTMGVVKVSINAEVVQAIAARQQRLSPATQQLSPSIPTQNHESESETQDDLEEQIQMGLEHQFVKHENRMKKLVNDFEKKEKKMQEKFAGKEHKKKMEEIKVKGKQHEKEIKQKEKMLKEQEKEKEKDLKSFEKVTKEAHKQREKDQKIEIELKEKEKLTMEKLKKDENRLRLEKMKEAKKTEDRLAKGREKEIVELKKLEEIVAERDRKYEEEEEKLLDKQLKRENKERLEKMKALQKQEEREVKFREKEIAELEKQAAKEEARQIELFKEEQKIVEKESEKQTKQKIKEMREREKAREEEAKEREKEIERIEKERGKTALEEFRRMQREGKIMEKKAEKDEKIKLRKMKQQQIMIAREAKAKAKEIAFMEKQQEKLAERELSNLKKEEKERNDRAKKALSERLKHIKAEQQRQDKDAKEKMKEIEGIEKKNEQAALKEMEKFRKEGIVLERRFEKENKAKLMKLKVQKMQEDEDAIKNLEEIKKLEAVEFKNAEKELERIKKEGKYLESEAEKRTKTKIKQLKEEQKRKDKKAKQHAKEVAVLEKMEKNIMIHEAMMFNDASKCMKLTEALDKKKAAALEKERLKSEVNKVIQSNQIDGETAQELQQITQNINQIEAERENIEEEKDILAEGKDELEQRNEELQLKTDMIVGELPEKWKNKIEEIRKRCQQKEAEAQSMKEKLKTIKESYHEDVNNGELVKGKIDKVVKENLNPEMMKKIDKLKSKKEGILSKILEAQLKLKSQNEKLKGMNEKEDEIKDQEDDIIISEEGDLKELKDLRLIKEEHVKNFRQLKINLELLRIEKHNLKEQLKHITLKEESLHTEDGSEIEVEELKALKDESTKCKEMLIDNDKQVTEVQNKIETETNLKDSIETKEIEFVKENISEGGQIKLQEFAEKRRLIEQENAAMETELLGSKDEESNLKANLDEVQYEEEETVSKSLGKEAKNEYKRLQKQLKKEQKEIKQKEKEIAKVKKMEEKARIEEQALKKNEEKILQKEAGKEAKEKLKNIKAEKKEQENLRKKKEKDLEALRQKEIKIRKEEKELREKEEKILEKKLEKEEAAKVKQLKNEQKEKKKEVNKLAREIKALEKAKEKAAKKASKEEKRKEGGASGKNNIRLKDLQKEQFEYQKQTAKLDEELESLQQKVEQENEKVDVDDESSSSSSSSSDDDSDLKKNSTSGKGDIIDKENGNETTVGSSSKDDASGDCESSSTVELSTTSVQAKATKDAKPIDCLAPSDGEGNIDQSSDEEETNDDSGVDQDEGNGGDKKKGNKYQKYKKKKKIKKLKMKREKKKKEKKKNKEKHTNGKIRHLMDTLKSAANKNKSEEKLRKRQKEEEKIEKKLQGKLDKEQEKIDKKLVKEKEKHEEEIRKEIDKNTKKVQKQFEKEQKKQMKLEKKQMKAGMIKDMKNIAVTTDIAGILRTEIAKLLDSTLTDPIQFVGSEESETTADVIKELGRNVLMKKFKNFDQENLVLKNKIKTLKFALSSCEEKNHAIIKRYQTTINNAEGEIRELEGYRDNVTVLLKQVDALHQQLHFMVSPVEYDKMSQRLQMLNRRIMKYKAQCDSFRRQKNELEEGNDILKENIKLEQAHKQNEEERSKENSRMCDEYRKKYLEVERKFDAYTKQAINEQRRVLYEYGYKLKDGAFQNDSMVVCDLKDRLIKLELELKDKQQQLDQFGTIQRQEKHVNDMLNEVAHQLERMKVVEKRYQEEKEILHEKYEKHARKSLNNRMREYKAMLAAPTKQHIYDSEILKKQIADLEKREQALNALLEKKEEIIKTLASNIPGNCYTSTQLHADFPHSSRRNCQHCTTDVAESLREKLVFSNCNPNQNVKKQLVRNPNVKIPMINQKLTVLEEFANSFKQQKFHIKELERAVQILTKEIRIHLGDGTEKIGQPVVERLAVNVTKMARELREFAEKIKIEELQNITVGLVPNCCKGKTRETSEKTFTGDEVEAIRTKHMGELKKLRKKYEDALCQMDKLAEQKKIENDEHMQEVNEELEYHRELKQKMKNAIRFVRKQNKELIEENEQLQQQHVVCTAGDLVKEVACTVDGSKNVNGIDTGTIPQAPKVKNAVEGSIIIADVLKLDMATQTVTQQCGSAEVSIEDDVKLTKELENAQQEIDELKERNEVLEEYYEENSKKPNEAIILKVKNEKLLDEVEILKAEIERLKKEKEEETEKREKVEEETKRKLEEHDHACFTSTCEKETGVELIKTVTNEPEPVIPAVVKTVPIWMRCTETKVPEKTEPTVKKNELEEEDGIIEKPVTHKPKYGRRSQQS